MLGIGRKEMDNTTLQQRALMSAALLEIGFGDSVVFALQASFTNSVSLAECLSFKPPSMMSVSNVFAPGGKKTASLFQSTIA